MDYLYKPFHTYVDFGFGAHADAFKEAADLLRDECTNGRTVLNGHLPINFLYRHSIELYLKSLIIIIHRKFNVSYGPHHAHSTPHVSSNGNWVPMYKIHSISTLFIEFKRLIAEFRQRLEQITSTDWGALPDNLEQQISVIDGADKTSTFLRYPTVDRCDKQNEKSAFKETTADDVSARMGPDKEYMKAFIVLNKREEIEAVYRLDKNPIDELSVAVREVASFL